MKGSNEHPQNWHSESVKDWSDASPGQRAERACVGSNIPEGV